MNTFVHIHVKIYLHIIKCYPEYFVYFSLGNFPRFVKALKDRAEEHTDFSSTHQSFCANVKYDELNKSNPNKHYWGDNSKNRDRCLAEQYEVSFRKE